MAQSTGVNIPGIGGGLQSFKEEYDSLINLKPTHVIAFIILIIAFRIFLGAFY